MAVQKEWRMNGVARALAPPWSGFIAAFVYYVLLSLAVFGGVAMSAPVVALAYLLPVVAYLAVLAARGVRALASMPVELAWH